MENKLIASRIKELRTNKELTQTEFAESINTVQAALSAYERGDRTPSLDILICIAQKYDVSIDWLCGLNEKPNSSNKLSTYSDLFALFLELQDLTKLKTKFYKTMQLEDEDIPFSSSYTVASLEIDDSNVVSFIDEWIDILKICNKSASGQKLYTIWKKDILEQYNKPFEYKTHDSEELPFN